MLTLVAVWFAVVAGAFLLDSGPVWSQNEVFQAAKRITDGNGHHLRPAWSPDGRYIAFQANVNSNEHSIYVIGRDGAGLRRLTEGAGDDRRPAWSPDGSKIAFDSARNGTRDIWTVSFDGSDVRQVTTDRSDESFASWSPDGSRIAYYTYADGAMDIWATEVAAAKALRLTKNLASIEDRSCTFGCHAVSWSTDGSRIAYAGGDGASVWVMNADGSGQRSMTTGGRQGKYHFPVWTEDGGLVFTSEELGEKPYTDVWMMKAGSRELTRLYTRIDHGGPFYWSPDGQRVAFHSPRTGQFQIYVAELGATGPGKLAVYREKLAVALDSVASKPGVERVALTASIVTVGIVAVILGAAGFLRLRRRRT